MDKVVALLFADIRTAFLMSEVLSTESLARASVLSECIATRTSNHQLENSVV